MRHVSLLILACLSSTPVLGETQAPLAQACAKAWEAHWPAAFTATADEYRITQGRMIVEGFAVRRSTGVRSAQTMVCNIEDEAVSRLPRYRKSHGRQKPRNSLEAIGLSCARLWEQTWPSGYISSVSDGRIEAGRYVGEGFAIHDQTHIRFPYRFFCTMAPDGKAINRPASYFALRTDQYHRTRGVADFSQNPQLPYAP
jgi:hypothetical protein